MRYTLGRDLRDVIPNIVFRFSEIVNLTFGKSFGKMCFMITVVNFSHPLNSSATTEITRKWGGREPVNFIQLRVQIDRNAPLLPQIDKIVEDANRAAAGPIHFIILPGLSDVAFFLAKPFAKASVIRMGAVPDKLPPVYMPVELIPPQ